MTDEKAIAQLSAYARGEIDLEEAIAVEALIEQYLEGLLEPDVVADIERVIESDEHLKEIIESARRGGAWIDDDLAPKAQARLDDPISPDLAQFVEGVIAGKVKAEPIAENDERTETVVAFRPKAAPQTSSWRPMLMAASVAALLVAGGAGLYTFRTQLDAAASRQAALQQEIEQLTADRDIQQTRIASLDDEVGRLQAELDNAERAQSDAERTVTGLQGRENELDQQVADLQSEVEAAEHQAEKLDQQRVELTADIERMQGTLDNVEAERNQATAELTLRNNAIADLEKQTDQLRANLAAAEESQTSAIAELAAAEEAVSTLRSERSALEQRVAALDIGSKEAQRQADDIDQQRTELAAQLRNVQTVLDQAVSERDEAGTALAAVQSETESLQEQVARARSELTESEKGRTEAEQQLAGLEADNDELRRGLANLQQQVATLALAGQATRSQLEDRNRQLAGLEQQLVSAQTEAADARNQIAQLAIERRDLDAELEELRGKQRWLAQVAQYHGFYANLPQRRWVEASAEDQSELDQLLSDLGQRLGLAGPLPLPPTIPGLDFAGGRPLSVNGMPVVQLAYIDPNGQLFAFCFMRNMSGKEKARNPRRVGDLTMIDWSDAKFQYVVVGYGPVQAFGDIAERLQGNYRLDT